MKATALIESVLRVLKGANSSSGVGEKKQALEALNSLISSWGAERLLVPYLTNENFTLTIGQSVYTIGSGGDFDAVRPIEIVDAYIRDSGGTDYSVEISTLGQYNDIVSKETDNRPDKLYYTPEYPLGKIYFNTEPSSAETLYLDSWKHLTELAELTTAISLPLEYKRALKWNLVIELAPEYGMTLEATTIAMAIQSKKALKSVNLLPMTEWQKHDDYLIYSLQR